MYKFLTHVLPAVVLCGATFVSCDDDKTPEPEPIAPPYL